jgi:hypothetical protein
MTTLHLQDNELLFADEVVEFKTELHRDSFTVYQCAVCKTHRDILSLARADKLLPKSRTLLESRTLYEVPRCTRIHKECHRLVVAPNTSATNQQLD